MPSLLVTKAFRLLWHFCQPWAWLICQGVKSQKPFGFFGISAYDMQCSYEEQNEWCHKSLSASLAFLPPQFGMTDDEIDTRSQKPFGFFGISANPRHPEMRGQCGGAVTKAFRLLWHFCRGAAPSD